MHRCLLLVRRNGLYDIVSGCITELETGPSLPEASQEAVTAANAVINQSVRRMPARQVFQ